MKTKRQALEMFRSMSDEKLVKQREMISPSMDYKMETKESTYSILASATKSVKLLLECLNANLSPYFRKSLFVFK